jgi:hypothetical protein
MGKNVGVFLGLNFVLLIFFVKFINVVFDLGGKAFVGELLLFGFFLAVALICMAGLYFNLDFAVPGLLVLFAVSLINTLFLYFNYSFRVYDFVLLSFVGLLGFIATLNKLEKPGESGDLEMDAAFDKIAPEAKVIFEDAEFELADPVEVAELAKYGEKKAIPKKKSAKKTTTKKKAQKKPVKKK